MVSKQWCGEFSVTLYTSTDTVPSLEHTQITVFFFFVLQCIVQLEHSQERSSNNVPTVLVASIKIEIAKGHVCGVQWVPILVRKVRVVIESYVLQ
jgi:hypothetical protein